MGIEEKKLQILLLEDMITDAELIKRELRQGKIDFSVRQVQTEEAFVTALDEFEPDLVLADYSLPSYDALAALNTVRGRSDTLPFILVSGALGDELAVETLRRGATDYVLKNKLSRLVPVVHRALREAEQRIERKRAEEEVTRLNEDLERRVIERTEQLQVANQELENAVRARETLLSVASHDLRNLVAAVRGSAALIERFLPTGSSQEAGLAVNALSWIDTATTKMNTLINEMLDFGRLQSGQPLDLFCRSTDLVALVKQVAHENQVNSDRHTIRVEAAHPEVIGMWDAPRLERLLDNLLSNAIKYSPRGGEIVMSVSQESDSWAEFTLQDHGIGIPASDLPYIFEWFRRAGNVSGRISGTGIGLASARQTVKQHGGTITVESEEGTGSTFTVRLPLKGPPPPGIVESVHEDGTDPLSLRE